MTFPASWSETWTAALGNHLWQSTAVTGIAWLLTLSLRNNHARMRYWVWMIASIKYLIPFSLFIAAGESLRSAFATPIQKPALAAVMEQITLPFPQTESPAAVAYAGMAPTAVSHPGNLVALILLAVWLCGFLFVLCSWSRGWLKIRASLRASSRMMLMAEVPVLSSPLLIEPGIFGIFRPVLLLPKGITDRLSAAQLGTIIAHEMCHVRRHDNLTAAIHMVVEALFWFHPAVWWIKTRLLDEREQACDEIVLQSGNEADVYAESILNVCKFCIESPLSCVAGVAGSDLKRRIVRIMTERVSCNLGLDRKLLLALGAMVVITVPIVFGLVHIKHADAATSAENQARSIAGTWQGSLHTTKDLRVVYQVYKAIGGGYHADSYSPDQAEYGLPDTKIEQDGATVRFTLAEIDGVFEGRLSPDANSIIGNWTQHYHTLPLTLVRATPETAWAISAQLPPMAANADPSLEAVNIKPANPGEPDGGVGFVAPQLKIFNSTLSELIAYSYGLHTSQIVGAPAWVATDKYDITGQPDAEGRPSYKHRSSMIQKLLAERFKLSFHRDKKEQSVYVLSVAKGGPKLAKSAGDPNGPTVLRFQGPSALFVQDANMGHLIRLLQGTVLDRPVLDQTGLEGKYDYTLNWTPDDSQFHGWGAKFSHPTGGQNAPPPLSAAIQEQLGLKLDLETVPADVLIIDHIEKP